MPRKKIEENHTITESVDSSTEDTAVYAEDMSSMAAVDCTEKEKPDIVNNPDSKVVLRLAKGATFTSGGKIYKKGILEPVPPDIAEKLMKTGFFERA